MAETGLTRRLVFEFSVRDEAFTGRAWSYQTEQPAFMVADMGAIDGRRLVVIERDAGRARRDLPARLRGRPQAQARQRVTREVALVVDLAAVPDPDLVSLPEIHAGDGAGQPVPRTCESVEAIHPTSGNELLIGCDNNLPNTGRNPTIADDTELIVVSAPCA